jgi:hypothetical protein
VIRFIAALCYCNFSLLFVQFFLHHLIYRDLRTTVKVRRHTFTWTPQQHGLSLLDSDGGSAPSCGMTPLLAANGTDIYRAEFPNGTSIQDYLGGSFSVWCKAATANFGEVVIPGTIPDSVSAVDDSSLLLCSTSMTEVSKNEPYLIGNLTTRSHNVAGTVYVISDHIIEIKVCIFGIN